MKFSFPPLKRLYLPIILILAFVLRVYSLNQYPIGFTPDEASFGYDAYSLIKTGRDQWGSKWPLVFKSFGDYKAPVYTYLVIPSVILFDLNKFSVRLPNALLGVAAVYVIWLLISEIIKEKDSLQNKIKGFGLPELTALIFALSPWHIMMSRGAFEANLITLFIPLGIFLFLKHKYYLSMIVFGLNLFTYHSSKLITPIIVMLVIVFFGRLNLKKILTPLFVFILFVLIAIFTITQGGGARIAERSITQGALEDGAKTKIKLIQDGMNPIIAKILHNKYQVVLTRFVNNYGQYFSSRFLIFEGPAETTYGMIREFGVLSYIEMFGLLFFVIYFRKIEYKNIIWFLLLWLVISPLPASLATGVGYAANRATAMIPVIQILASIGIYYFVSRNNKFIYLVALILILSGSVFIQKYFVEGPGVLSKGMLNGNLEMTTSLYLNSSNYDEVVVSKSLSEPHIYIAFAGKIDPIFYQSESKNWKFEEIGVHWVDQIPEYRLGKFVFK